MNTTLPRWTAEECSALIIGFENRSGDASDVDRMFAERFGRSVGAIERKRASMGLIVRNRLTVGERRHPNGVRVWGKISDKVVIAAWGRRLGGSVAEFDKRHGEAHDWPVKAVCEARMRLGLVAHRGGSDRDERLFRSACVKSSIALRNAIARHHPEYVSIGQAATRVVASVVQKMGA